MRGNILKAHICLHMANMTILCQEIKHFPSVYNIKLSQGRIQSKKHQQSNCLPPHSWAVEHCRGKMPSGGCRALKQCTQTLWSHSHFQFICYTELHKLKINSTGKCTLTCQRPTKLPVSSLTLQKPERD